MFWQNLRVVTDQRIHARVETAFKCVISSDRGRFDGEVNDLSYGGALVSAAPNIAAPRDTVWLTLDLPMDGSSLTVVGELRRCSLLNDELCNYGIRFSLVEPDQRDVLRSFVEYLLASTGVGDRQAPRAVRSLELICSSTEEFRGIMRDMSRTGIGLECDNALLIEEQLALVIRIAPLGNVLRVNGRVVHTRELDNGRHHVGLKFGTHSSQKKKEIKLFLTDLMRHEASKPT